MIPITVNTITTTTTTTESSKARENDENDDSDNSQEGDSPYTPVEDEISSSLGNEYEETEEEEIARIMYLASKAKSVNFNENTGLVATASDDAGQDYSYLDEETFIVNGDDTEISAVPWQASLRSVVTPRVAKLLPQLKLKNCTIEEGLHFCGGSIISDTHILSATHCFLVG